MRQGFKGHQSNCSAPFEVWGADSTCPSMMEWENDDTRNHPYIPYGVGFPYNHTYDDEFNSVVEVKKKIVPEPPWGDPANGKTFPLMAAKVPASYPGTACTKFPPTSSFHDENTWSANLGSRTETRQYTVGEVTTPFLSAPRSTLSSRAIYIDGKQKYLNYRCTALIPGLTDYALGISDSWTLGVSGLFSGRNIDMGSHHVIEIANTTNTDAYNVEFFGMASDAEFENNLTLMEKGILMCMGSMPYLTGDHPAPFQLSSYNFCSGKDYFICTSYSPDATRWHVGRVKYQGTRTNSTGATASGIETFASQHFPSAPVWNYVGHGDVGEDHEGEYAIVLPSIRSYIDTSRITETNPTDECWVIAARVKESDTPGIVAAQWIHNVYRTGVGAQDAATGVADGTLHSSDVAKGQLILDPSLPTWSLDSWDSVKIRCYNRVYNKRTGHSTNLAIFTSGGGTVSENPAFIADFEQGDEFDIHELNHGLPEGTEFNSYGTGWDFNEWQADNSKHHDGSTSAKALLRADLVGTADLEITVNVLEESEISWWYYFDNRGAGDRFGTGSHELTNQPVVEHQFKVYLDGGLATMSIDFDGQQQSGDPIVDVAGVIDNANLKMEDESFTRWYKATVTVPAGTHTLHWSVNRYWADDSYSHLIAHIDEISFPKTMAGSDINGAKRWYFDGTTIREAKHWAWAKKNEEGVASNGTPDPIVSRGSTVPDFITMDSEGDILYGNCHYVVKIRMDEGHEGELDTSHGGTRGEGGGSSGGYVRFTATPNIEVPPDPPCDDPDPVYTSVVDIDSNPPWGAFQILPTSAGYQIRGANASIRDATAYPIDKDLFRYKDPRTHLDTPETFYEYLNCRFSGCFPNRPHAWTVSKDGKTKVPHLMVYWRPTMYCMAWPEAPDLEATPPYPSPPYRADFDTITPDDISIEGGPYQESGQGIPGMFRYRNPLNYPVHEKNKTFWDMKNWIIPNNYSANLYRIPQYCWVSITDDPPDNPASPYYYIPEGPNPPGANNPFPWFSARWVLVFLQSYLTGGYSQPFIKQPGFMTELCEDENGETEEERRVLGALVRLSFNRDYCGGNIDYDAIYEACDCCK